MNARQSGGGGRQQFAMDRVRVADSGCWEWIGSIDAEGYARIGSRYMHRESYEAHRGFIPDGLHIDHLCRVRHCVNPDHLEPVTQGENTRRGWAVRKSGVCKRGHDVTDDAAVYVRPSGQRDCRACAIYRSSRRWAARKEVAA